uniref:P1 n=1 Tax=Panagrellus redivivus TaxID=6233 RepID=A0A7E4VVS2_PANRE
MDAAIGALGASDEVFNARHASFFEDLSADRSDLAFTILADLIHRLTVEQYQGIQSVIQRKLAQGGTLPASPGIAYFAHAVLSKAPKAFEHNKPAIKTIVNNSLTADFRDRFIHKSYDSTFYSGAQALYATFFGSDCLDILRVIPAVASGKQPKKNEVSQLGFVVSFWKKQPSNVVKFLWELFDIVIMVSHKPSNKLNIDALFNAVEKTIRLKIDNLSTLALNALRSVAVSTGAMFDIYLNRLYNMLNTVEVNPVVLYPFLTDLVLDFGPAIHFSTAFPNLVEQFTESLSLTSEKRNDMYAIGREKIGQLADRFEMTAVEAPAELHALVVALLENSPLSIPAGSVLKIQTYVCRRLLEKSDSLLPRDLALLNALLASSKENVPSVVAVARHVYYRQSVVSNADLAPYVRAGRAYCDVATQARSASRYTDLEHLQLEPDTATKSSFVLQATPQAVVESTPAGPAKVPQAPEKTPASENSTTSNGVLNSATSWLAEHITIPSATPVADAPSTPKSSLPSLTRKQPVSTNATPASAPTTAAKSAAAPIATKAAAQNAADGAPNAVKDAVSKEPKTLATVTPVKPAAPSVATKASVPASVTAPKSASTPATAAPPTDKSTPAPDADKASQNKNSTAPAPSNDSDDDIQFIEVVKSSIKGKKRSLPKRVKAGSPPPKKAAPMEPDDEPYTLKKINISDMLSDLRQ